MTRQRDLHDLKQITRAHYDQHQQRFSKIVAQENALRGELARLDEMNRNTQPPEPAVTEMRAIGADVIWQGWLGRAKTSLNLQLARVLAVKERHLIEVRRAFGKVLVVEDLSKQFRAENRKLLGEKVLSDAITQAVQNGS